MANRRSYSRLLAGKSATGLSEEQRAAIDLWSSHPWAFFTGEWEGKPIYMTRDEAENQRDSKIKPFPKDWPYLKVVTDETVSLGTDPDEMTLAIWKSRRTFTSYTLCGVAFWECLFVEASNWIVSKVRQDDAAKLMLNKVWATYKKLPQWFRQAYPVNFTKNEYRFEKTDSYMEAAAQNFHQTSARGQGGNVLIDEAAFFDNLREAYEAAQPMAQRIVMASTPGMAGTNTDSNLFFRELVEGDTVEEDPEGPIIPADGGLLD